MNKKIIFFPLALMLLTGCFRSSLEKHSWFKTGFDWECSTIEMHIYNTHIFVTEEQKKFNVPVDGYLYINGVQTYFMMGAGFYYENVQLYFYNNGSLMTKEYLFLEANVAYNRGDKEMNWDVTYDPNFGLVGKTITFVQTEIYKVDDEN